MPTGDLPGWKLKFNEDFDKIVLPGQFPSAVSDRWSAYPNTWRDTSGFGRHAPERVVSWHDSMMDLWLRYENGEFLVASPRPLPVTYDRQLYGRYAVRFRADPIAGYKAAWLLWPTSEAWPRDGEIDFPEGSFDKLIYAFMHRQGATSGSDQDAFPSGKTFADWHTAVIEWAPGSCKFFIDEVLIGHATSRVPNTQMRYVMQSETNLGSTPPPVSSQGHVYIDWVALWSYSP